MIEQIEEVGLEGQPRCFRDLEALADIEVHVREVWAKDAVATNWRIAPEAAVDI